MLQTFPSARAAADPIADIYPEYLREFEPFVSVFLSMVIVARAYTTICVSTITVAAQASSQ